MSETCHKQQKTKDVLALCRKQTRTLIRKVIVHKS